VPKGGDGEGMSESFSGVESCMRISVFAAAISFELAGLVEASGSWSLGILGVMTRLRHG
jgi:hypothetical protein